MFVKGDKVAGILGVFSDSRAKAAIQEAVHYEEGVRNYAEQLDNAISPIYSVIKPKDRNKNNPLSSALLNFKYCRTALAQTANNLNILLSSEQEHSKYDEKGPSAAVSLPSDDIIKFLLAAVSVKEAIGEITSLAEDLAHDTDYGSAINEVLGDLRTLNLTMGPLFGTPLLLNTLVSVETLTFASSAEKREALKKSIAVTELALKYGQQLASDVVYPALDIFCMCDDRDNESKLFESYLLFKTIEPLALVALSQVKNRITHSESFSEGSAEDDASLDFAVLKLTGKEAWQAIQKIKSGAQTVQQHQESWPLDVKITLEALHNAYAQYETALSVSK